VTPGDAVADALRLVVADPQLGRQALSDPAIMAGVLGDYLPDAPRETAILKAAISAGVPGMLETTDLPPVAAIRLAEGRMADRSGYPADTCEWAARQIAVALGLAPPVPTVAVGGRDNLGNQLPMVGQATAVPVPVPTSAGPQRRRRRAGQIAVTFALIAVVGGGTAYALTVRAPHRHPASSRRNNTPRHTPPATSPAAPRSSSPPLALADVRVCTLAANGCNRNTAYQNAAAMQIEPTRIYTTGDGSGFVDNITWTGWATATARGLGVLEVDNCTPTCAAGAYTGYRATITLTDLVGYGGGGKHAYAKMVVRAPGYPYKLAPFTTGLVP
jgi:hypothetical protein